MGQKSGLAGQRQNTDHTEMISIIVIAAVSQAASWHTQVNITLKWILSASGYDSSTKIADMP